MLLQRIYPRMYNTYLDALWISLSHNARNVWSLCCCNAGTLLCFKEKQRQTVLLSSVTYLTVRVFCKETEPLEPCKKSIDWKALQFLNTNHDSWTIQTNVILCMRVWGKMSDCVVSGRMGEILMAGSRFWSVHDPFRHAFPHFALDQA